MFTGTVTCRKVHNYTTIYNHNDTLIRPGATAEGEEADLWTVFTPMF